MYTGIIQATAPVISLLRKPGLLTLTIQFPDVMLQDLQLGASVSVDGVCLSVVAIANNDVTFDVMAETLARTTLGLLQEKQRVHLERSARAGDEIGGHQLSGHIDAMAEIIHIDTPENNYIITFQMPEAYANYFFEKGFIALAGASLTLVDVNKETQRFKVHLIPETLKCTTFKDKKIGDTVNVEIDRQTQITVDTVESFLASQAGYML